MDIAKVIFHGYHWGRYERNGKVKVRKCSATRQASPLVDSKL